MFRQYSKNHFMAWLAWLFIASHIVLSAQSDSLLIRKAYAQNFTSNTSAYDEDQPVDFEADNLSHDEATQTITATGNVELVQAGRILRADLVSYNLASDTVRAQGNVVLTEVTGDTYFADDVQFTNKMRDGFVKGLQGLLADGSRFSASKGQRIGGTKIVMHNATYTPCEPCKEDPSKPPVWQLKAERMTHDQEEKRISYRNATFELAGVPIAYTPYFSHPDGSVKRKSGVLAPTVGFDSDLGTTYQQEYYWSIAPDKDVTFGVLASSKELPVALTEYRQRFDNASIELEGGVTYSERDDSEAGVRVKQDEELRGHLFGGGLWDINKKWRAGLDLELTSDDQYARQYDITSEDVLENEVYLERFSGRNYAHISAVGFQDIRVNNRQTDQPNVLPEIEASFIGEPNAALGGRWGATVSAIGLQRDDGGQDLTRGSLGLEWQKRTYSTFGLVNTFDVVARGDSYYVSDRDVASAGSGRSSDSSETRGFAQAQAMTSYPLSKSFSKAQAVIEPTVALAIGTNVDVNDDVPNEDSQDVQLDASNIFESNRFAGYDRIEDRAHASYGVRTGIYGYNGSHAELFLGQTYRFDSDDNPFPEGSGLSEKASDSVGQIKVAYGTKHDLTYRFQLDNDNFSSKRHEFVGNTGIGPLDLSTRYFFAKALQGTDITESREQLRVGASYILNDEWRLRGYSRHDFAQDAGLRQAGVGVDYFGQCITVSATAERNLTNDESGDSGTDITFRIGLRNLGEFVTSGLSLDGSDE